MGDRQAEWIRVPVDEGELTRWATRGRCRRVLFVVHNVTSSTRLLDVIPLFRGDFRIQMLATCTGSSPFQYGVARLLERMGLPVLPWEQALATSVDLAISASFGGQLDRISGQLVVLSHGVGYNKKLAVAGSPDHHAFGLSPQWLLGPRGSPVADAIVLSHPEQAERLRRACPDAAHTAVVAGDPCFDRMLAALPYRDRYRRTLDVRRGQRLVVLNSTWNPESLAGDADDDVLPALLARLTSELPVDEYRLAAVLHPNIWNGHGPGQVRSWMDRACRAGLTVVDPLTAWRQTLIAADLVIGDFGSVTYYAAALGIPVLLGTAGLDNLSAASPIADFVRRAPVLDPYGDLGKQLERAVTEHRPLPGPAELTTSVPGQAAALLRALFYEAIGTAEPDDPAGLHPLELPPYQPPARTAPLRVITRVSAAAEVVVTRFADPDYEPAGDGAVHTVVHEDTFDRGQLQVADLIHRLGDPSDVRFGSPEEWTAEVLRRHPYCALAVYVTGPGACTIRTRAGDVLRLTAEQRAADPVAFASAVHARLAGSATVDDLVAGGLSVRTGRTAHRAAVTRPPSR